MPPPRPGHHCNNDSSSPVRRLVSTESESHLARTQCTDQNHRRASQKWSRKTNCRPQTVTVVKSAIVAETPLSTAITSQQNSMHRSEKTSPNIDHHNHVVLQRIRQNSAVTGGWSSVRRLHCERPASPRLRRPAASERAAAPPPSSDVDEAAPNLVKPYSGVSGECGPCGQWSSGVSGGCTRHARSSRPRLSMSVVPDPA